MSALLTKCPCCGGSEPKPHCERAEDSKAKPCRWVICRSCKAVIEPESGKHSAEKGHRGTCVDAQNHRTCTDPVNHGRGPK